MFGLCLLRGVYNAVNILPSCDVRFCCCYYYQEVNVETMAFTLFSFLSFFVCFLTFQGMGKMFHFCTCFFISGRKKEIIIIVRQWKNISIISLSSLFSCKTFLTSLNFKAIHFFPHNLVFELNNFSLRFFFEGYYIDFSDSMTLILKD